MIQRIQITFLFFNLWKFIHEKNEVGKDNKQAYNIIFKIDQGWMYTKRITKVKRAVEYCK